jgi:peptidoglycan/xylan/chitin deacetylase (PgdA/CDA1 family)
MRARRRGPPMPLLAVSLILAALAAFWLAGSIGNAGQVQPKGEASSTTTVSLTWDDATSSQYSLAFLRAMQPHDVSGTFFINSGNVGTGPGFMTWSEVHTLADAGNDIAGHTIDHVNLTDPGLSLAQKTHQVCDDRQALIDHGFEPSNFAYPYAALDQTAEHVVKRCGYDTARSGGGASPRGPVYAEGIPPQEPYSTRAWSPPGGEQITLPELQAVVEAAARNGGGWVQIVGHAVCSQALDQKAYADCSRSYGWIDLDTLNRFLDWVQNAGVGGAPAGAVMESVADVLGNGPSTQAPTT